MLPSLSALLLGFVPIVLAQQPNTFVDVGDTLASAMMLFVGNSEKVYIIDKAEGNAAQVNGHPAWGSVWDINTRQYQAMDILTNVFCASGMHLPNGSFVTFGGNGAVGVGGVIGSVPNNQGSASFDATYKDYDGGKSIRILNPCSSSQNFNDPSCQWFDNPAVLSMQKRRWYSAAEPLADGTVVLIGGYVNGGYVNRNFPNVDPMYEGGAAEPTYEFFPTRGPAQNMTFMTTTSGLNSYAHTFLMPSGNMFVQANFSTILWNYTSNVEQPLPDMPGKVVRVYPASGAVAMLPLTPANNWTPTILFCGGSDMPSDNYGDYAHPATNTWEYPASRDCQRITPEPTDGSTPVYVADDQMVESRTMGQFIILPDGTMLVINGALNGTAGYADKTGQTPSLAQMPYAMSLASGPVLRPSIYDPNAAAGSRWSSAGLPSSTIPRLYHSSAILLPDGSVFVAGSNPNVDVNLTAYFPTTYRAEIFYPPYFSAKTRPKPSGIPNTLSYGGNPFDVTVPASSYSGSSVTAANSVIVSVVRSGFTTHAMNMGQRFLQLNNTYTVNQDGSLTLHVSQMPPNPNIYQPGPAFLYVVVNGIPSSGSYVIVGNGQVGPQPISLVGALPGNVQLNVSGTANPNSTGGGGKAPAKSMTAVDVGIIIGGVAALGIIGALVGIWLARRRRASVDRDIAAAYPMSGGAASGSFVPKGVNSMSGMGGMTSMGMMGTSGAAGSATPRASPRGAGIRDSDSSMVPLAQAPSSPYGESPWNHSTTSINAPYPYHDYDAGGQEDFNPYAAPLRMSHGGNYVR